MDENKSPVLAMYNSLCREDPIPKNRKPRWVVDQCAVCGRDEVDVLSAGSFLGAKFGSWQDLNVKTRVSYLCIKCAWAFKEKRLLRMPVWVEGDRARFVTWNEIAHLLLEQTVDGNTSAILPYGGRKIVAPYAKYGHVSMDTGVMKWEAKYKKALACIFQLNKVNIRGSQLTQARPPMQAIEKLPEEKQEKVYAMWNFLKFIREDKTLAGLYVKLSMNLKGEK